MPKLEYDIWGRSDRGRRRKENEDAIYFVNSAAATTMAPKLQTNGYLMAVADGVGSIRGGAHASRLLIEQFARAYYEPPNGAVDSHLGHSIDRANAVAHITSEFRNASTTLVSAVIHDEMLYVAHVGDSRAYLIRNNQLKQLTMDHVFGHRLTRYLVSTDVVEPDVLQPLALRANDRVLLCSDGLYKSMASDQEMIEIATAYAAEEAVNRLIGLANANGGRDNISVVLAHVRAPRRRLMLTPSRWESL